MTRHVCPLILSTLYLILGRKQVGRHRTSDTVRSALTIAHNPLSYAYHSLARAPTPRPSYVPAPAAWPPPPKKTAMFNQTPLPKFDTAGVTKTDRVEIRVCPCMHCQHHPAVRLLHISRSNRWPEFARPSSGDSKRVRTLRRSWSHSTRLTCVRVGW